MVLNYDIMAYLSALLFSGHIFTFMKMYSSESRLWCILAGEKKKNTQKKTFKTLSVAWISFQVKVPSSKNNLSGCGTLTLSKSMKAYIYWFTVNSLFNLFYVCNLSYKHVNRASNVEEMILDTGDTGWTKQEVVSGLKELTICKRLELTSHYF